MTKLRMGMGLKKLNSKLQIKKEILQRTIDKTKEYYLQGVIRERKNQLGNMTLKKSETDSTKIFFERVNK